MSRFPKLSQTQWMLIRRHLNEHVDAVLEDETGAAFENLYVETQQLEARLRQLVANMTDLTQQHNRAV